MDDHFRRPLHVAIFPLLAQGHMNPMIDFARILASHGCRVTLITTPLNSSRYDSLREWSRSSGLNVSIALLPFPSKQAGLPENFENMDSATTSRMVSTLIVGCKILQQPFQEFLKKDPPGCIISDFFFPWTLQAAQQLNIPRYSFNVTSCFSYCVLGGIPRYKSLLDDQEEFVVPGLPHQVKMMTALVPDGAFEDRQESAMTELIEETRLAEKESEGSIFNTSYEMESAYVEHYKKVTGKPVFTIGPLSLTLQKGMTREEKGRRESWIEGEQCLSSWLDSKAPRSVLYVCFGSITSLSELQLMEIGLALESSNHPFIWVMRRKMNESFLQDLQERVEGRGLVITVWVPQLLILSHKAVGAFMSHCGWNSVMEGLSAGLPFITWPMFGEQYVNEKLLVDVLGVAISVGNKHVMGFAGDDKEEELVRREQIERAVTRILGDGEEVREKARELGELVRRSIEVGSSALNLKLILQNLGCSV